MGRCTYCLCRVCNRIQCPRGRYHCLPCYHGTILQCDFFMHKQVTKVYRIKKRSPAIHEDKLRALRDTINLILGDGHDDLVKPQSLTREIVRAYHRYNGKPVYCPRRKRIVTQRIHVLSNVDFQTIPFERLQSLSQFVGETDFVQDYDDLHDCLTVTYLLIDEASSQLNSRSFKSNFDAPFISRLLTSRHVRANLVLTSQRSGMVDKLMRDCCNWYISCQKLWRFEILRWYDAYSIECAQEPDTVPPKKRTGYFIKDNLFAAYDTYANVKALEKSCKEGDMLSAEQILALRVGDPLEAASSRRQAKKNRKGKKR